MSNYIMVACDLHDKTMVLLVARNKEKAVKATVPNDPEGRRRMIEDLQCRAEGAGKAEVVFAYEASGQGFGLHDELTEAGIRCYVLAPIHIPRSPKHRVAKNDHRDAQAILRLLRGHLLAGSDLHDVWIPDPATRDDRELVRARLEAGAKLAKVKNQIKSLLKRHELRRPAGSGKGWTQAFLSWLRLLANNRGVGKNILGRGTRAALKSLLRQMDFQAGEVASLEKAVVALSQGSRYAKPAKALMELKGVGCITAMVFLAEIGDLKRFRNRRQLASFLGLVPCTDESGKADDRKGHINRQGSPRIRKVVNQAVWSAIRSDPHLAAAYRRIVRKHPHHKKIAVVAAMRRLSVVMWHRGLAALEPPPRRAVA
ncbi:MAG: IS110 family transposase [Phycisphaerae bacterium]|nr:IS110 family transposase [Phycisphaerae bacterium]